MGSVYAQNFQQIRKICNENHFVVQRFIMTVWNNHLQENAYAVFVKNECITDQMAIYAIFIIISDSLSEHFVRYSFTRLKYNDGKLMFFFQT